MARANKVASVDQADRILRIISEGTANDSGEAFFRSLARSLAAALDVRWGFVSEFTSVKTRVNMLAYWNGKEFSEPFEYDLHHTPCESVLVGEIGYYPDNVQATFPLHPELAEVGIESYLAIPVVNQRGEVLGHLGAMDCKPMVTVARDLDIFKIFGSRAAVELERQQAERLLLRSERRLSSVLETAMDAIVTINAGHHITLFNSAAEKVFRCNSSWAIDQPIDRFISKRFRKLLNGYLGGGGDNDAPQQTWVPEGLTGLRADGTEFPLEATISPVQIDKQTQYTIILRDINERAKAETAIRTLQLENVILQEVLQRQRGLVGVIGESAPMQELFSALAKVADTDATVLLMGETGTGKEVIACALHQQGRRKTRPLVVVNCAALPSELIESELFGHERGAFTGATNQRRGRFELADGGTIFLDEVGELSPAAQAKLLRVLQDQSFERVGGGKSIKVDAQVIAATNRNLAEMVTAGTFRADLYYRLNVFPVLVPSLRERRSDIPLLVNFFIDKFARKLGKPIDGVAPLSMERLRRYDWPGNVRELQNIIERSAILSSGPVLEIQDALLGIVPENKAKPLSGTLDEVSRQYVLSVLNDCAGVIEGAQGAAAILGLKPSTLRYRMKLLGIGKPTRGAAV